MNVIVRLLAPMAMLCVLAAPSPALAQKYNLEDPIPPDAKGTVLPIVGTVLEIKGVAAGVAGKTRGRPGAAHGVRAERAREVNRVPAPPPRLLDVHQGIPPRPAQAPPPPRG